MEDTYQDRLVDFYPENIFFNNKAKGFQKDSLNYIESTFNLYQQILKELPASTFSSKAHYRLGELQLNIMHDFVGARNSYYSALKSRPNNDLLSLIHI